MNESRNGIRERRFIVVLGQGTETVFPSTGSCDSWNGKNCGVEDTVDVGRGHGSCNSNVDCPCCAPFCSKAGYCQTTNDLLSATGIEDKNIISFWAIS